MLSVSFSITSDPRNRISPNTLTPSKILSCEATSSWIKIGCCDLRSSYAASTSSIFAKGGVSPGVKSSTSATVRSSTFASTFSSRSNSSSILVNEPHVIVRRPIASPRDQRTGNSNFLPSAPCSSCDAHGGRKGMCESKKMHAHGSRTGAVHMRACCHHDMRGVPA